jgi:hypothetical protein
MCLRLFVRARRGRIAVIHLRQHRDGIIQAGKHRGGAHIDGEELAYPGLQWEALDLAVDFRSLFGSVGDLSARRCDRGA